MMRSTAGAQAQIRAGRVSGGTLAHSKILGKERGKAKGRGNDTLQGQAASVPPCKLASHACRKS